MALRATDDFARETPRVAWAPSSGVQPIVYEEDEDDFEERTDRVPDLARLVALTIPPDDEDEDDACDDPYTLDDATEANPRSPSAPLPVSLPVHELVLPPRASTKAKRSIAATVSIATGVANVVCIVGVVALGILSSSGGTAIRATRDAEIRDVHRVTFAAGEHHAAPVPRAYAQHAPRAAKPRHAAHGGPIIRTAPF